MILAIRAARQASVRHAISTRTCVLLTTLLVIGMFGAAYSGNTLASAVLSVRIVLLTITVSQLLRAYDIDRIIRALGVAIVAIVALSIVTGSTHSANHLAGRLQGGIPPLQPNEITAMCGLLVLGLVWRQVRRRGRRIDPFLIALLIGVCWMTGSRTGLVALLIAVLIILVQVRLPTGAIVAVVLAVPIAAYLALATPIIAHYLGRGGETNLHSLSDRTVAWSAAIHLHTGFWDTWFGNGLSVVQVPVVAAYRTTQLLDSSWISALVQSGLLGLLVFAVWILTGIRAAWGSPQEYRPLMTGIMVFVVFRSFLESGLVGATPAFIVFMIISMCPRWPARLPNGSSPAHTGKRRVAYSRSPSGGQPVTERSAPSGTREF